MQWLLMLTLAFHVLSAVFWVGSTFTLARIGGLGAERLFRPQMGAATLAVITGAMLWHLLHRGNFDIGEYTLALGAACAIAAAGVQGIFIGSSLRRRGGTSDAGLSERKRIAIGYRIAAILLGVTLLTMTLFRYL